jgi:hypothetical protein
VFNIFETLIITSGRITGQGFNDLKSDCIGFSSEGIGKLLLLLFDNNVARYITNHFVVKYYNANSFVNTSLFTNSKELAIYFKGIEI